ncbi:PF07600 family protein [Leptospira interrogans serovar Canicola]|nr:PF07600 family protein [Leptospira interrogans serovar Canicola]
MILGTASSMNVLLLNSDKKIQSALNEGVVGSDSLLIPLSYWNQLDKTQRKALSKKTSVSVEKIHKVYFFFRSTLLESR